MKTVSKDNGSRAAQTTYLHLGPRRGRILFMMGNKEFYVRFAHGSDSVASTFLKTSIETVPD